MFDQEQMEQPLLVDVDPFASLPFHVVVLDQDLQSKLQFIIVVNSQQKMNDKFQIV